MSETTKNLKLFKYNTTSDANVPFSIDNALNANWDILDENWSKGAGVLPGFLYKVTGLIDESENIFRYANGQVITEDDSVSGLSSFLDKQEKLGADIFCTELEWQNIKTTSKLGQVGKYVRDKKAGTIRLPLILNEQGLVDLANCGVIKDESLPNITGKIRIPLYNNRVNEGAFYIDSTGGNDYGSNNGGYTAGFNASRSSSTYQDDAPVQQEAIQYPYVICVNTGVEETERPINNYQVNNVYSYGMSQYYKGTMNNNSWLRSSGQWNSGTVYNGVYEWAVAQQVAGVDGFKLSTEEYTDYDWVLNTTDETFRLPIKNGQEGVFASGVKGNGISLGLTDGTNNYGMSPSSNTENTWIFHQADYNKSLPNSRTTGVSAGIPANNTILGITSDSSKSGIVVDLTVPSGYNLYYYIGDVLENADLINIARMQEELVDKTTAAQAAHAAMPSGKCINLTLGASGQSYTAPADGYFFARGQATANYGWYDALTNSYSLNPINSNGGAVCLLLPIKKGETMTLKYGNQSNIVFRFVYAVGSEPIT